MKPANTAATTTLARPIQTSARLPALSEDEPEPDEGGGPHHAARGVVREEHGIAHARGTGHERRQRPEEPDEPADEDGLAPVSREEAIHPLQGRAIDADPPPVFHERGAPGTPAELIAECVTENRAGGDDDEQIDRLEDATRREKPREQHDALAGYQEADEGGRLQRRRDEDGQVSPVAEIGDHLGEAVQHAVRQ